MKKLEYQRKNISPIMSPNSDHIGHIDYQVSDKILILMHLVYEKDIFAVRHNQIIQ